MFDGRVLSIFNLLVSLMILCSSGCASFNAFDATQRVPDESVPLSIVRGEPNVVLDTTGRLFGIPNRLAILDRRVDNHDISAETESELTQYMQQNGLNEVLVRVNQYDPIGEWKRLVTNRRIRPFWRATFGTYGMLKYTFLPGRVLGGDWYNPFTDTINLYSDLPEFAISEAAYAADVRSRLNPGAYSSLKEIPFVGLSHETRSTEATLEHFGQLDDQDRYEQARDVLIPNYGADWGGQIASFLPYGTVIGRIIGGTTARISDFVIGKWRKQSNG